MSPPGSAPPARTTFNASITHGPDTRYAGQELCFSSDSRAFSISNVTDKRNPSLVASSSYPNLAYTHQGWLDEDHRYFYMNDEGDEAAGLVEGTRTLIWDVQDLEDPILVSEYTTDNPATDHNLYIVGDVMYQSNYRSGCAWSTSPIVKTRLPSVTLTPSHGAQKKAWATSSRAASVPGATTRSSRAASSP